MRVERTNRARASAVAIVAILALSAASRPAAAQPPDDGDDMSTFVTRSGDKPRIVTDGARPYKEEASRLAGGPGACVVYRTASSIRRLEVYAFGDDAERLLRFEVSSNGRDYRAIAVDTTPFPTAVNPYGYKLPVRFRAVEVPREARFVKIVFASEGQIGRVVIASAGASKR